MDITTSRDAQAGSTPHKEVSFVICTNGRQPKSVPCLVHPVSEMVRADPGSAMYSRRELQPLPLSLGALVCKMRAMILMLQTDVRKKLKKKK